VLIANDRLALLPEICAQFAELKNEREGVLEAEIHTAFPLDNAQINGLVAGRCRGASSAACSRASRSIAS